MLLFLLLLAMFNFKIFWYVALIAWAVTYLREYPAPATRRGRRRHG